MEENPTRRGPAPEAAIEYDLGNLMAFDPRPLDETQLRADPDGVCAEVATTVAQLLFGQLFSLPTAPAPVGRLAQLPPPTTPIPRQKPLPKPRAPTKWEKFAQQKGIQKTKRSKLVYDEQQKEWRRRYGYKRANDPADVPIIEAKAGDEVGEDPFTKQKEQKAQGIKAQEKRQLANAKASAKQGAAPSTLRLAAALPDKGKGKPIRRRELVDDVRSAGRQAGVSTASMGKFDRLLTGEKPWDRTVAPKRRAFAPVAGRSTAEQASTTGMVDRILRERSEELVDMSRAVGQLQADRRAERHHERASGSADDERRGKRKGKGKAKGKGPVRFKGKGSEGRPAGKAASGVSKAKARGLKKGGGKAAASKQGKRR